MSFQETRRRGVDRCAAGKDEKDAGSDPDFAIDNISAKTGRILFTVPPDFQTNLTRVRGSLALSRSYEDSHVDANSFVRDNREWLRIRVDAFCAFFSAFLHVENVSAGRQRDTIVSRLVCSQSRDLSFPVLTQDDQWILGISFWCRLWHVIRFNRPDHDNLQMPLHETLG